MSDEDLIGRMRTETSEYPAIMNHLISRHSGLVRYFVRTIGILSSDTDDLIQEGMIGLFDAISKYDPSRGASFKTYASLEITGNVYNAVASGNSRKNQMLKDYVRIDTASYDPESEGFSYNPPSDEMTPEEREATITWEKKMLEIMEWITDDVDWITKEHHSHVMKVFMI